jgi:hypothetical protein
MVIMFFPFEKQEKKVALSGTDTHQRLILLLRLVKFNRSRNLIWIYITFLLPCQPCQHWIATRDRSAHVLQDQHVHTRCRRRRVYKMRLRFKNSWGDAAGIISSLIDIKWRAVIYTFFFWVHFSHPSAGTRIDYIPCNPEIVPSPKLYIFWSYIRWCLIIWFFFCSFF